MFFQLHETKKSAKNLKIVREMRKFSGYYYPDSTKQNGYSCIKCRKV